MRSLFLVIILLCGLFFTINPIEGYIIDQENTGNVIVSIKHHNPSDLVIKVGQINVAKDYLPSKGIDTSKAKIIKFWNRDNPKKAEYADSIFFLNKTLKTLGLTKNPPPQVKESVWFIDIEDHGKSVYEPEELRNRTEKEIEESINYLVDFNVSINDNTYVCLQHPYFDDGGVAHGEIYGLEEEIVIMNGVKSSIDYDNAMGIIGISKVKKFWGGTKETPGIAHGAWAFYDAMNDLAYEDKLPYYTNHVAIDGGIFPTHERIYRQTVNSIFSDVDSSTDGNDNAILYIEAHGYRTAGFQLYDSCYWGPYTPDEIGSRIGGMTIEGTKVWYWACSCYSDTWDELWDTYSYHRNKAVYWTYYPTSWATKYDYEIPEFKDRVRSGITVVEALWIYCRRVYENEYSGYYMRIHDECVGPIDLVL